VFSVYFRGVLSLSLFVCNAMMEARVAAAAAIWCSDEE